MGGGGASDHPVASSVTAAAKHLEVDVKTFVSTKTQNAGDESSHPLLKVNMWS